jgi:hypothetical protein
MTTPQKKPRKGNPVRGEIIRCFDTRALLPKRNEKKEEKKKKERNNGCVDVLALISIIALTLFSR